MCIAAENTAPRLNPRTNMDIMNEQIRQIGEEIVAEGKIQNGDSVVLRGDSISDNWMIMNSLTETFRSHQCRVFQGTDSVRSTRFLIDLHPIQWNVHYDNIFHTGIFGQKFLTRSITSQVSFRILSGINNEILTSKTTDKTFIDTVAMDALPAIENRSIKSTLGILPPDPFLDKVIEPFIIIGAAGVAIYLLFHIRSS